MALQNRFINATHDFTERDQAIHQYRELEAQAFRRSCSKAFNKTAKMAVKDLAFLMACAAFVAVVIVVLAVIVSK